MARVSFGNADCDQGRLTGGGSSRTMWLPLARLAAGFGRKAAVSLGAWDVENAVFVKPPVVGGPQDEPVFLKLGEQVCRFCNLWAEEQWGGRMACHVLIVLGISDGGDVEHSGLLMAEQHRRGQGCDPTRKIATRDVGSLPGYRVKEAAGR